MSSRSPLTLLTVTPDSGSGLSTFSVFRCFLFEVPNAENCIRRYASFTAFWDQDKASLRAPDKDVQALVGYLRALQQSDLSSLSQLCAMDGCMGSMKGGV
ncbi:hypothetical protein IE81DRAFT_121249 [Ceraceosorus guamensis]|uniref:Uncharacterized protein n=1 Tax=Ceraceosorus guamensis TaxID=1522189 RepID=A0A316W0B7_9BASI|nr:hypothetical protein IE81DRAFT_121249 [Ceraceosorus guamensis]PWN42568.1 hypothetical protein IE81DRAFT_121249 [Ceraceosorus guamensis]